MINDAIESILKKAGTFSESYSYELTAMTHLEIYKPKQIIHAAGQVELNLYLIQSGFARGYYYDRKGKDHTVRFWNSGDLLFSYEGYYKVPSFYYTEFMESTQAIALSYVDLIELNRRLPETSLLIKYALLKSRIEEHERQHILTLPANERYERLFKNHPVIFQKSPAKYISSYLNMSRETLARLMGKH
ncbi:Crp/Fnr family transcriptional regulator [Mucilaginibacter sp. SMC90]|uniref:Crp/Fnr family transcriptional regulator n=1 Tax=Mucilaginibacter sp. SMC90 TaxID=2929803 RepID=UPI001FB384CC|nr:Crp/Fnr family transcriptional regulator [Mucilaginibacter sp. SMC90]UOE52564.1 Crp/Fnr family transcriptional regulator [Mucilaginibacter sp. SMC90]